MSNLNQTNKTKPNLTPFVFISSLLQFLFALEMREWRERIQVDFGLEKPDKKP